MNWAHDNARLSETDLETGFKFDPQESTIVQILASNNWRGRISSRKSEEEWSEYIKEEHPSTCGDDSGLVLLLAKRLREPGLHHVRNLSLDEWKKKVDEEAHVPTGMFKRADTFAPLQKQQPLNSNGARVERSSGKRGVRTVPFSKHTFQGLGECFHTHASFTRVVCRSDVPVFTCDKVLMKEPAYVYNCRSSNAWPMDLALTVTHFPKSRLTFAILLGCPFDLEKEIITRLATVEAGVAHPLLMPGLFAEMERNRHTILVEEMGNKLETLIFRLNYQSDLEGPEGARAEARSKEKRTAYLDLAYLRNSLISWNTQLDKMVSHCRKLASVEYGTETFRGDQIRHEGMNISGRSTPSLDSTNSTVSGSSIESDSSDTSDTSDTTDPKELDRWTRDRKDYFGTGNPLVKYEGIDHYEDTSSVKSFDIEDKRSDVIAVRPYVPERNQNEVEMKKQDNLDSGMNEKDENEMESTEEISLAGRTATDEPLGIQDPHIGLRDTGHKIMSRLLSIQDEYNDKIRDCTMRVDGMAMATQWSNGETNVEIALATNRDSRHMRSIALVTMLFLPGTFFATMFSMTFFNWSNDTGSPTVSKYIWTYVVITVFFTSLTIGIWYYIVVFRPSRKKAKDEEEE